MMRRNISGLISSDRRGARALLVS